ncbi:Myb-DNA-bind-3 domain-containing protein [Mycena venus]|uniref:Myb-DNA-bind-3 domain-containing protein n=1 Tax=Mycena venus TaxID=2733690 RepID=A0A8H6XXV4_9AGAR|nr:Myb-DNA-bind-3 domain-containing protein [Mycena venus]
MSSNSKAVWIDSEVLAMLNKLNELKLTEMSGNGWKPSVWTPVIAAVEAANPTAKPKKDKTKVKSKLDYLKGVFEDYLFVKKFSGTGWDDENKCATNTEDYIEEFVAAHGQKYAKCFEKSCPFYDELDNLYEGLKNKATGDHVVTFGKRSASKKKRTKSSQNSTEKENPDPPTASQTTPGTESGDRAPMTPLNMSLQNDGEGSAEPYDDELSRSPPKPSPPTRRRTRADSDAEDEDDVTKGRKRLKSDSSTSSTATARRNAAAGSQIARSVDNLAASMGKPIVTTEDMSHVNDVVEILKDDTLLPPDPNGRLFRHVLKALTGNRALALGFIAEDRHVRRKGVIAGILEDAGITVPDDF